MSSAAPEGRRVRLPDEEKTPQPSGGDSGKKDESVSWDVTNAKGAVNQVLRLFPDMTRDKTRTLLEMVCDDCIDESETF
jgi:hypothetical protein